MADAKDGDVLTYTLVDADGGVPGDSARFAIDWATGQIMTKEALDFEDDVHTDDVYMVTVRATDPAGVPQIMTALEANSDEIVVTITVTNVDEAPDVSLQGDGDIAEADFEENGAVEAAAVATYEADDPETTDDPTFSLTGADSAKFAIGNGNGDAIPLGQLRFKASPDFEKPGDADADNVYEVTVVATDAGGNRGAETVKVTVTNVDEDGVVTLSRTQPRVGVPVTASLTDPDGSISRLRWQWSRDTTENINSFIDIPGATSDTYTPVADDAVVTGAGPDNHGAMFLRATATYTDAAGATVEVNNANEPKTAGGTSDHVVEVDTRNKLPAFVDQDTETKGKQNETAAREVEENTKALAGDDVLDTDNTADDTADNVGGPVNAVDPDPNTEPLIYTLSGPDAASFRVRQDDNVDTEGANEGGQIEVAAGTKLDYETKQTYMVTLTAEDSFGASASIDVTITVTDVDEAPEISEGGLAITGVARMDYAENETGMVAMYTASGPESANAMWSLEGDDAGAFDIEGGVLTFVSSPDYEMPMDMGGDNMYMVTVMAYDGTYMDTQDVTVMVTNVDEMGMVTLPAMQPRVGTPIMATLTDDDGMLSSITWQWASSSDMSAWTDIVDATSDVYTPVAADAGSYLQATAMYTDGEGSGKSKMAVSANMVVHLAISGMSNVEYDENGAEMVATYSASVPDADMATWTLEGADAGVFDISSDGVLTFVSAPDYETPADADMDNTYMVTVIATDSTNTAMHDVTVMVTDVEDTTTVIGGTLLDRFDSNDNDMIDKVDVTQVIRDYLFGDGVDPSKADVVAVIRHYLFS